MGEKRKIVCCYVGKGLHVLDAITIAGIKKSTYYYCGNGRSRGKRASTHTFKYGDGLVPNGVVVDELINLISPEYHDYGYKVSCELLKRMGYIINHKKVLRLMKESNLLHPQTIKSEIVDKAFIKYTIPPLDGPFEIIEADIKYVYVYGENRNAFLLTFLCTFCRYAPVWKLQYSMPSSQVIDLVKEFINHPLVTEFIDLKKAKVIIRTDNGPQFIAKKLAIALDIVGINHEFIEPGTPQQNGHIESFHSTVTRLVCQKNIFLNLGHTKEIFKDFFFAYNNTRVMKALLYYPPKEFLMLWKSGIIDIKRNNKNREIFFFKKKPIPFQEFGSSYEDLSRKNKINNFEPSLLNHLEISPVL